MAQVTAVRGFDTRRRRMRARMRRWSACALTGWLVVLAVPPAPAAAMDNIDEGQWYVQSLRLREAHRITQGKGVTVAVIDGGVGRHADLAGNVLPGKDARPGTAEPDARNDESGHGTAMAGLIGAHGRVLGVAPQATILPLKYKSPSTPFGEIETSVNWAVAQGAKVISISQGYPTAGVSDRRAVENAIAADVVIVASAGNADTGTRVEYPAAYPGVVAVGGVDRDGNHSKVSVRGFALVLCAPAEDISSTAPGGKYRVASGTSSATALVAGAVALVRAKFPELSAQEVIHRLTATADDRGRAGRDDEYGYGVINIVRALTADVQPSAGAPTSGGSATGPAGGGSGRWVWVVGVAVLLGVLLVVGLLMAQRAGRG
ncbi:S8 family serine peptidase [Luedemannella helvata]|uniref:Type VII secretion-associated serine protease mycosin n=1 Tax=Luedemannella helvata TaxID=349315 RepID=A0ABP4WG55_9ACTN